MNEVFAFMSGGVDVFVKQSPALKLVTVDRVPTPCNGFLGACLQCSKARPSTFFLLRNKGDFVNLSSKALA